MKLASFRKKRSVSVFLRGGFFTVPDRGVDIAPEDLPRTFGSADRETLLNESRDRKRGGRRRIRRKKRITRKASFVLRTPERKR